MARHEYPYDAFEHGSAVRKSAGPLDSSSRLFLVVFDSSELSWVDRETVTPLLVCVQTAACMGCIPDQFRTIDWSGLPIQSLTAIPIPKFRTIGYSVDHVSMPHHYHRMR
jgi:hypothetical protein